MSRHCVRLLAVGFVPPLFDAVGTDGLGVPLLPDNGQQSQPTPGPAKKNVLGSGTIATRKPNALLLDVGLLAPRIIEVMFCVMPLNASPPQPKVQTRHNCRFIPLMYVATLIERAIRPR